MCKNCDDQSPFEAQATLSLKCYYDDNVKSVKACDPTIPPSMANTREYDKITNTPRNRNALSCYLYAISEYAIFVSHRSSCGVT